MKANTIQKLLIFLTGIAVLAAMAIQQSLATASSDDIRTLANDTMVINTTNPGAKAIGYSGKVPLEIYLVGGRIVKITALPNAETTYFFNNASQLLTAWDGLTPEQALGTKVDAVSGATYSSRAIIGNVHAGLALYQKEINEKRIEIKHLESSESPWEIKNICALIVLLAAMIVPLFWKNRWYRIVQLVLNIVVLGLWCTTFINYLLLLSAVTYGLNPITSLLPLLMLIAALIYPLFGKQQYYCTNICPLGSAQELAGKIPAPKLHIGPKTAKWLTTLRNVLWATLMVLMAFGIWAEWMDLEPFSAFALQAANTGIIIFACTILIISIFVPRAYCRFACPTGTFLKSVPQIKL